MRLQAYYLPEYVGVQRKTTQSETRQQLILLRERPITVLEQPITVLERVAAGSWPLPCLPKSGQPYMGKKAEFSRRKSIWFIKNMPTIYGKES